LERTWRCLETDYRINDHVTYIASRTSENKAGPPTLLHIVSLEYLHIFSPENKRIFIAGGLEEEQQVPTQQTQ